MIQLGALPVPGDVADRVREESYARLLGYPDGRLRAGRARQLAAESREWFARHARPWGIAAYLGPVSVSGATIAGAGELELTSGILAERCRVAGARGLVVALVTAGAEVDRESAARWAAERPDEAYFVDRFGAAVAVYLGAWAAEHLRTLAEPEGLALAPGHSPGHDGWPLSDQPRLAAALQSAFEGALPGALRVHSSGMLEPKSSLLAAFPLGTDRVAAERLRARHTCSWCSLTGCALRGTTARAPRPGSELGSSESRR